MHIASSVRRLQKHVKSTSSSIKLLWYVSGQLQMNLLVILDDDDLGTMLNLYKKVQ